MPLITPSTYSPAVFFRNGHIQTVYSSLVRKVAIREYQRERIETDDGDFLDLDWAEVGASRVTVLTHGLEGSSNRPYIRGMVRALNSQGWDAVAWNMRGCSGEGNRKLRFYHSGDTADLDHTVRHVLKKKGYREVAVIGFSLGGNITLKYVGEQGAALLPAITKAVALSVPCDLAAAARQLAKRSNRFYMRRFLRSLHEKVKVKMKLFPGQISDRGFEEIRTFQEFDDRYTAPLHNFRDAEDYWGQAHSRQFLKNIIIPSLLINAQDDPFLPSECYPVAEAQNSTSFFLETPRFGGHVGFVQAGRFSWAEQRAMAFLCS